MCMGMQVIKWPQSFISKTNNTFKTFISTLQCTGQERRDNQIEISKYDPFIVRDFEKVYAVYGGAVLEECNYLEFMSEEILKKSGWIHPTLATKIRRLTATERKSYEKSSSI